MAKLNLIDLTSLQNETSAVAAINNNSSAIESAFENTLSRNGATPNAMGASLDMNSNRILNLPEPGSFSEPVRLGDIANVVDIADQATLHAFLACASATASNVTGDGTAVLITFDSELLDSGGAFSNTIFTAPSTGIYSLSGTISLQGVTAGHIALVELVTTQSTYQVAKFNAGAIQTSGEVTWVWNSNPTPMDEDDTASVRITVSGGAKVVDIRGDSGDTLYTFFGGEKVPFSGSATFPGANFTYDLIVKGGNVIDTSQAINDILDVGIKDGVVIAVDSGLDITDALQVYDATGYIVTPGIVDLLTHNFPEGTTLGTSPDVIASTMGVTTTVSPGDFGAPAVGTFRASMANYNARILGWLSISKAGYTTFPSTNIGLLAYASQADATAALIANSDILLGIKVLFGYQITGHLAAADDFTPLDRALAACAAATTATGKTFKIMIHIGGHRTNTQIDGIVSRLRSGDIITHSFVGYPNYLGEATTFAQGGAPISAIYTAQSKGIILDCGYSGSMDYVSAIICMKPLNTASDPVRINTLSADNFNVAAGIGTANTAMGVMSEFLAMNIPSNIAYAGSGPIPNFATVLDLDPEITLEDVIRMTTETPGSIAASRVPLLGTLQVGAPGDVTIMELQTGSFSFEDSLGHTMTGTRKLVPIQTVVAGNLV